MVKASQREAVKYRTLTWYLSTQINLGVFLPLKKKKKRQLLLDRLKRQLPNYHFSVNCIDQYPHNYHFSVNCIDQYLRYQFIVFWS